MTAEPQTFIVSLQQKQMLLVALYKEAAALLSEQDPRGPSLVHLIEGIHRGSQLRFQP